MNYLNFDEFYPMLESSYEELFYSFNEKSDSRETINEVVCVCRWFRFAQLAKGKKFRP